MQGEKLVARALERRIATLTKQIQVKTDEIAECQRMLKGDRALLQQAIVKEEVEGA